MGWTFVNSSAFDLDDLLITILVGFVYSCHVFNSGVSSVIKLKAGDTDLLM